MECNWPSSWFNRKIINTQKLLLHMERTGPSEELNGYLIRPAKWIKGTKMAFAGLRKRKR